jgi:hypothetical protein
VPLSVPDQFPFEAPGDQPLHSLTGGSSGTEPILAEVLQTKWSALQTTIGDLADRLTVVEAAVAASRWRHITTGSQSGGAATPALAVPSGFLMLRLAVWGDMDAAEDLMLRVNGDSGSNHIWGLNIRAADGTTTSFSHSGAGTGAWRIGRWATTESNNSLVNIFPGDGGQNPSYLATAHRVSTGVTGHQIQHGYGKYLGDVVVSSLTILANSTTFQDVRWVLEGYLA